MEYLCCEVVIYNHAGREDDEVAISVWRWTVRALSCCHVVVTRYS